MGFIDTTRSSTMGFAQSSRLDRSETTLDAASFSTSMTNAFAILRLGGACAIGHGTLRSASVSTRKKRKDQKVFTCTTNQRTLYTNHVLVHNWYIRDVNIDADVVRDWW